MNDSPTSDQPARSPPWFGWLLALAFFTGIAPTLFFASAWVIAVPINLGAQAFGVTGDALSATTLLANFSECITGGFLTWLAWRQAVAWYKSGSSRQ
jgi:hypothetical protein